MSETVSDLELQLKNVQGTERTATESVGDVSYVYSVSTTPLLSGVVYVLCMCG